MADPVLVFTLGFFFILILLAKFTGICVDSSNEYVKEDGIAVDISGNPINPAEIQTESDIQLKLEDSIEPETSNVLYN